MSTILFQFLWRPYTRQEVSRLIVVDIPPVSRATVPIICFATVEIHQADRVMRQFGLRQNIPPEPVNLDQVHKDDLRGRNDRDWVDIITSGLQFGMIEKIGSLKVHLSAEMAICVMKHRICSGQ